MLTKTSLEIVIKRLNESQDILERIFSQAIKSENKKNIKRVHKQMQIIGTKILDYEFRLEILNKKNDKI